MDQLLEAIRAATAPDASTEIKEAGATACRTLLIALEGKEGEPLAAPLPVPVAAAPPDITALVAGLKGVPVDQLLDLAIAKLRSALPAGTQVAPVRAYQVPLIPLGPLAAKAGSQR